MKRDIDSLREQNSRLAEEITLLSVGKEALESDSQQLKTENQSLVEKVKALEEGCNSLKESELEIRAQLDSLSDKLAPAEDLDKLGVKLEQLASAHNDTQAQIDQILSTITEPVGDNPKDTTLPDSGIFTYFEKKQDALLFIEHVDKALRQQLTYAQIDDFLTKALPSEIDSILKDHPSLTKQYIRETRNG